MTRSPIYRVPDAAREWGVSVATVYNWRAAGKVAYTERMPDGREAPFFNEAYVKRIRSKLDREGGRL